MTDTVQEVLERAARILERDGWCQGQLTDCRGAHCIEGALLCAGEELDCNYWPAFDVVRARVKALTTRLGVPFLWNDFEGRTKDEVLALLRGTR